MSGALEKKLNFQKVQISYPAEKKRKKGFLKLKISEKIKNWDISRFICTTYFPGPFFYTVLIYLARCFNFIGSPQQTMLLVQQASVEELLSSHSFTTLSSNPNFLQEKA